MTFRVKSKRAAAVLTGPDPINKYPIITMTPKKKRSIVSRVVDFLKKKSASKKLPSASDISKATKQAQKISIAIYESELQFIGVESIAWDIETGGDLFGIWNEHPIIYLATRTGPNSIRENAHFKLDVDYLIKLSNELNSKWGLRYFGDWHSHHHLDLDTPSTGDQSRIKRIAVKNNFDKMAEFIVTFPADYNKSRRINIHPYSYVDLAGPSVIKVMLSVIKGVSPIREALIASSSLAEQDLGLFSSFPIRNIVAPIEMQTSILESVDHLSEYFGEKILTSALTEFKTMSSHKIERYQKSFGHIVVVPIDEHKNIAFAVDNKWPYKILQVDWIDRSCGKAEEVSLNIEAASLINMKEIKNIFSSLKDSRKS